MARPRKDAPDADARKRILEEFWALYRTRPLEKITVRELCEKARCNKTTFYYHFQDTRAVLEELERESIPRDIYELMVDLMLDPTSDLLIAERLAERRESFERYCHLLGPAGDPAFRQYAKDTIREAWSTRLSIDYNALDKHDRLLAEFVLSGTTSLLGARSQGADFDLNDLAALVRTIIHPRLAELAANGAEITDQPPKKELGPSERS